MLRTTTHDSQVTSIIRILKLLHRPCEFLTYMLRERVRKRAHFFQLDASRLLARMGPLLLRD